MKPFISAAAAVVLGVATASAAQGQDPPTATVAGASMLALVNLPANGGAKLTVTSPALGHVVASGELVGLGQAPPK